MQAKTTLAIDLFISGKTAEALKIFKTFKIGFSKDEIRTIQIAYESLTGNEEFYKAIRLDTATIRQQAMQLIKQKYNL